MSQPQTQKWLGRERVALTFRTRPCLHLATRPTVSLGLTAVTVVALVNAVVKSRYSSGPAICSVPAADGHSHWWLLPSHSVLSEKFRKTQWPGSRRQLSDPCEFALSHSTIASIYNFYVVIYYNSNHCTLHTRLTCC